MIFVDGSLVIIKSPRGEEEMKKIIVVALAVLLSHSVAFAGVATDVLNVKAQIVTVEACTVTVVNQVNFGTWDGTIPMEAVGDLEVTCTVGLDGLPYTIALDAGQNFNGEVRSLSTPLSSVLIAYYLYKSPGVDEWGDGITHPALPLYAVGSPDTQIFSIYGLADPNYYGMVADGTYDDIVTVTVSY